MKNEIQCNFRSLISKLKGKFKLNTTLVDCCTSLSYVHSSIFLSRGVGFPMVGKPPDNCPSWSVMASCLGFPPVENLMNFFPQQISDVPWKREL